MKITNCEIETADDCPIDQQTGSKIGKPTDYFLDFKIQLKFGSYSFRIFTSKELNEQLEKVAQLSKIS